MRRTVDKALHRILPAILRSSADDEAHYVRLNFESSRPKIQTADIRLLALTQHFFNACAFTRQYEIRSEHIACTMTHHPHSSPPSPLPVIAASHSVYTSYETFITTQRKGRPVANSHSRVTGEVSSAWARDTYKAHSIYPVAERETQWGESGGDKRKGVPQQRPARSQGVPQRRRTMGLQ